MATTEINAIALTFAQYREANSKAIRAEYGISVAEFEEFYPRHELLRRWITALERAADNRERLPDTVLDSFCREVGEPAFYRMFRGIAEQHGYIPPSVRRKHAENHREWVEARKRGRAVPGDN